MAAPLGLLGGTFDPVHQAHLMLAHAAMTELGLSGVRWIPSGRPGHRRQPVASVEHRLAMLRLALAGEPRYFLDETDARSGQAIYTIDTLARLRRELGNELALVFIIGADQFVVLDTWREWRRLFDQSHFAVAQRPGYVMADARLSAGLSAELAARHTVGIDSGRAAGSIVHFSMPSSDISATAIRKALAANRAPVDALPAAVLDYIRLHHLYSESGI